MPSAALAHCRPGAQSLDSTVIVALTPGAGVALRHMLRSCRCGEGGLVHHVYEMAVLVPEHSLVGVWFYV